MPIYVARISHGKDSLKMLDVIVSRGLPLDRITTSDVWATDTISACSPEVEKFKARMDEVIWKKYRIEVEHLCARNKDGTKKTYEQIFYKVTKNNTIYGFPIIKGPWCQSYLKVDIFDPHKTKDDIFYIGIAADEPKRFGQLNEKTRAPLVEFGIEEGLCGLYCQYGDMLSPSYETSCRDGCWFCHNQSVDQLRRLRKNYPDRWELLLKWDKDSPITFKPDGHTVHDLDYRFQCEDEGLLPHDKAFRWGMLDSVQLKFF